MEKFKVGDEVIIWMPGHRIHLTEAVVTGGYALRTYRNADGSISRITYGYRLEVSRLGESPNHDGWGATHKELRKKPPPRDDLTLVKWSECPWQPKMLPR